MSQSAATAAPGAGVTFDAAQVGRVAAIALQLALLIQLMSLFAIESEALVRVAWLTLPGFVVHAFLPMGLRRPAFVALSMAAVYLIFEDRHSAWLIGVCLAFVGVCRLPIALRSRVAIVAALGLALAAMRAGWIASPWPVAIWPILGSMLMFRLIIYLFDRSHEKEEPSVWSTLSYFFLLPNPVFALFPVVDYRTMQRTWYDDEDWRIYQNGVKWIFRGVVHLIVYKAIKQNWQLAPSEVDSSLDLAQFLVTNFSLYLHVSGTFHIAVGMLHLFGFNLPETHFFFFLSSSINDFWRRINIYWKDFMLKVFYYPAFFRLRRRGATRALVISTVYVVLVTWFLHSYQWFWLRGSFPVHWQDVVFWTALGALMIANSIYENRRSKARGRHARTWDLKSAVGQGLSISGTFAFIVLLWSLWTCDSWDAWVSLFAFSRDTPLAPVVLLLATLVLGVAAAVIWSAATNGLGRNRGGPLAREAPSFVNLAAPTAGALLLIWLIGLPAVQPLLGARASALVASAQSTGLSRLEASELQRSYYENLIEVGRFNPQLNRLYNRRPDDWVSIEFTDAVRHTDDLMEHELLPHLEYPYKGGLLVTNSAGMRDREYTREKPPGVRRIGVIGGSYGMGPGVDNDEIFLHLVEERLGRERAAGAAPVQLLNFSVGGYFAPHRLVAVERKVLDYDLDVLVYMAHENEISMLAYHLNDMAKRDVVPEYPELRAAIDRAGYRKGESLPSRQQLEREGPELIAAIYQRVADAARARGAHPVWLFIPTLAMLDSGFDSAPLESAARAAGFDVLRVEGVYAGHDPGELQIAPWDMHPNAVGHQLIAEAVYHELIAWNPGLIGEQSAGVRTGP